MKVLNNCECLGYFVSLKRHVNQTEEREDLLCTQRLLMNQKKKLQQMLFSTS